jgi:hypothetical protein
MLYRVYAMTGSTVMSALAYAASFALNAVEGAMVLTGTLGAGFLAGPLGITPMLAVQGAASILAGAGLLVWLRSPGETPASRGNQVVEEAPPSVMREDRLNA